jgi:hypothetical protein
MHAFLCDYDEAGADVAENLLERWLGGGGEALLPLRFLKVVFLSGVVCGEYLLTETDSQC